MKFFLPVNRDVGISRTNLRYSYRARALLMLQHLPLGHGYIVSIEQADKYDVVVVGKNFEPHDIQYLADHKIKFILDINDYKYHINKSIIDWAAGHASLVTTTCIRLQQEIKKESEIDAVIIPDATERPKAEARFKPKEKLKLVYYGSRPNYLKLNWDKIQHDIQQVSPGSDLSILTHLKSTPSKEVTQWTYDLQGRLVDECDLVILPVVSDDIVTECKGNNRPVDALQQGRFVISTPGCPSYEELKDYIWIGDIKQGIRWALDHPSKVVDMIKEGQKYIEKNFDAKILAQQWQQLERQLLD